MNAIAMRSTMNQNGSLNQNGSSAFFKPAGWEPLLAGVSSGKTLLEVGMSRTIFLQGERADSVFYIKQGTVKLSVTSEEGKDAIFALAEAGELFGEGCLAGQQVRMDTASALTDCTLIRIDRNVMANLLHDQQTASELLVMHLLRRNIRYEEDLVDQLFNTSEQRLARSLLLLAHINKEGKSEPVKAKVNQETLAQMVGTTRSRVSHFMNKFRQRGLVDYNSRGELMVTSKLLRVASSSSGFSGLDGIGS
jgi:CRP/FNR family transcriptional regulator, cyclic AMP receptor protein